MSLLPMMQIHSKRSSYAKPCKTVHCAAPAVLFIFRSGNKPEKTSA